VITRHGCGNVWCIKVRVFLCRNVRVRRVTLQTFFKNMVFVNDLIIFESGQETP